MGLSMNRQNRQIEAICQDCGEKYLRTSALSLRCYPCREKTMRRMESARKSRKMKQRRADNAKLRNINMDAESSDSGFGNRQLDGVAVTGENERPPREA
jgi:hypothetical protein